MRVCGGVVREGANFLVDRHSTWRHTTSHAIQCLALCFAFYSLVAGQKCANCRARRRATTLSTSIARLSLCARQCCALSHASVVGRWLAVGEVSFRVAKRISTAIATSRIVALSGSLTISSARAKSRRFISWMVILRFQIGSAALFHAEPMVSYSTSSVKVDAE
jgi:hypothetical protein